MAELYDSDNHSDDYESDEDYESGVADEDEEVRKGKLMRQIGLRRATEHAAAANARAAEAWFQASLKAKPLLDRLVQQAKRDKDFVERSKKKPRLE